MAKKRQQPKEAPALRRKRRSIDGQIADLQAKISSIKEREARRQAKSDPALRYVSSALKAVDKALAASEDGRLKKLLAQARATLASCLGVEETATKGPASARRFASDNLPEDLLTYVRNNPGQRGEQIAKALGTDAVTIRPAMKQLINAGKITTEGQKRGMTYSAV